MKSRTESHTATADVCNFTFCFSFYGGQVSQISCRGFTSGEGLLLDPTGGLSKSSTWWKFVHQLLYKLHWGHSPRPAAGAKPP